MNDDTATTAGRSDTRAADPVLRAGSATQPGIGRLATASSVGTTLEWYDFTVYNTLAALIFNQLFFPTFDPLSGTILAFSTYAVGYVSRPLGGVVFGHLGDKLGRRFVLVTTLILMGVTTGLMGVLPTYASAGILSPICSSRSASYRASHWAASGQAPFSSRWNTAISASAAETVRGRNSVHPAARCWRLPPLR